MNFNYVLTIVFFIPKLSELSEVTVLVNHNYNYHTQYQ